MAKDLLAPGFKRFEFRKGSGFKSWGGMLRNGDDAAAMQNNQFTLLQNTRFIGGDVRSRYGQTKVNSAGALLSKVDMINADPDGSDGKDGGIAMYAGAAYVAPPPGAPAGIYGTGSSVNYWNGSVGAQSLSNTGSGDLWFDGTNLYHCGGGDPAKIYQYDGTSWTTMVTEAGGWNYKGIVKAGSTFYLMTSTGAIRTWDGSASSTTELESAGFGMVGSCTMTTDGTSLWVVYTDGLSIVKRSGGSWTYKGLGTPPVGRSFTGASCVASVPGDAVYALVTTYQTGQPTKTTCHIYGEAVSTFDLEHNIDGTVLGSRQAATSLSVGEDNVLYYATAASVPEVGTWYLQIGTYNSGTGIFTDAINSGGSTVEDFQTDTDYMRFLVDGSGNCYSNHDSFGYLYQWTPNFTGTTALIDGTRSYKSPVVVT